METTCVAGESLIDLALALRELKPTRESDGWVQIQGEVPVEIGAPLWRALMRIEAELLSEDADRVDPENGLEIRSHDERGYDAFVELIRRLGEATSLPRTTH
jgi:hypothetical protein